jgi:hypothetical protein
MDVSGQLHDPAVERAPSIHWTEGWMGPRASLDESAKRKKISAPTGNGNQVVQPITSKLTVIHSFIHSVSQSVSPSWLRAPCGTHDLNLNSFSFCYTYVCVCVGNNNGQRASEAERCCKLTFLPTLSAEAIYTTHAQ